VDVKRDRSTTYGSCSQRSNGFIPRKVWHRRALEFCDSRFHNFITMSSREFTSAPEDSAVFAQAFRMLVRVRGIAL
jgi:hypothetical protein